MADHTIDNWIEQFRNMPLNMALNHGISREKILSFLERYHVKAPEDYIHFMELSNGANLFDGRIIIWEIPENGDDSIPKWKSITYMNREEVRSGITKIDGVFLIASDYIGNFIGLCTNDKEFDIIFLSPESEESWNYQTFTEWLEDIWEEMAE